MRKARFRFALLALCTVGCEAILSLDDLPPEAANSPVTDGDGSVFDANTTDRTTSGEGSALVDSSSSTTSSSSSSSSSGDASPKDAEPDADATTTDDDDAGDAGADVFDAGPTPDAGTPGASCSSETQCNSKVCTGGKCQADNGDDGVQNGPETDIDCGGGRRSCDKGKKCLRSSDCSSLGCDYTNHCAARRGCTREHGGKTCGTAASPQDCCESIALPAPSLRKLDKYLVTAGRMRAFIDDTNGDIKTWYAGWKFLLNNESKNQIDPIAQYLPTARVMANGLGAEQQVGGSGVIQWTSIEGCYVGTKASPAYGAHTYFTTQAAEGEERGFGQDQLDELPLNCMTYPMLAAFCAWDGNGHVPTEQELNDAWGPDRYPWGNSPLPGGYSSSTGNLVGPADNTTNPDCPTCVVDRMNWSFNSLIPPSAANANDYAKYLSVPGRFPLGATTTGYQDLAGLLIEMTATTGSPASSAEKYIDGTAVTLPNIRWNKSGSWEGHKSGGTSGTNGFSQPILRKYGKTGGRCIY